MAYKVSMLKLVKPILAYNYSRMYRFRSHDRDYTSWSLEAIDADSPKSEGEMRKCLDTHQAPFLSPVDRKLFSGDILGQDYQLISSPVKSNGPLPGVLVLSGTTYGRNSKNKVLYKCVPDDPTLPVFIVPYTVKEIGFAKKRVDRYVTFEFREWSDKHPVCALVQNIGEVNDNEAFYEYQLHRRGLAVRRQPKRTEQTRILKKLSALPLETVVRNMEREWGFEDRTNRHVITIDPEGCRDFDDALGIEDIDNGKIVSVYISNVAAWLECLGEWQLAKGLPATIYLPHRTVPMLTEFLSTNLCSLVEGRLRPVLAMDVIMKGSLPPTVEFRLATISVSKNYRYEEDSLISDGRYAALVSATEQLQRNSSYVSGELDSHGVVAYYMIYMNHMVACILHLGKQGISRTHSGQVDGLGTDIGRVIEGYNGGSAKYVRSGGASDKGHGLIGGGLDHYTHVTSPIRRAVDLANMVTLQQHLGLHDYGVDAQRYVEDLGSGLAQLNEVAKKISRVHSDCNLLEACTLNKGLLEKKHAGVVVDITRDVRGVCYIIFMEELGTLLHLTVSPDKELLKRYSRHRFSIHLFKDERTLSRKIRLGLEL